jgi:hypothetical protein
MKVCGLLRCSAYVQAEVHKWGQDLANMDEARDRAVVELNRLDMVHDLILQYQGVNRREVWSFESNSELCCFNRLLQRTLYSQPCSCGCSVHVLGKPSSILQCENCVVRKAQRPFSDA